LLHHGEDPGVLRGRVGDRVCGVELGPQHEATAGVEEGQQPTAVDEALLVDVEKRVSVGHEAVFAVVQFAAEFPRLGWQFARRLVRGGWAGGWLAFGLGSGSSDLQPNTAQVQTSARTIELRIDRE
jgi:hypothetical protein